MSDSKHPAPPRDELPSLSSSLLERVQQMQPEAWGQVATVFSPIVYRWCRQAGLNGQDSSDVVQDVFSSVARGIVNFQRMKAKGSFRSWLATITRNAIRDFYRRQAKQPQAIGGTEALGQFQQIAQSAENASFDESSLEHSVSEENLNQSLPARVLETVQSEFEPITWQAFWKTTVDGVAAADVAQQLGLNVASVYQAKSRVLRRFRQRMQDLP